MTRKKTNNFRFYGKNIRPFTDNENTHYHPHEISLLKATTVSLNATHPFKDPISESRGAVTPMKTVPHTAAFEKCHTLGKSCMPPPPPPPPPSLKNCADVTNENIAPSMI